MADKQETKEKNNLSTNSAIRKINLKNKKLTQLLKIKKKEKFSGLSKNLFQKSKTFRGKMGKIFYPKRKFIKQRKNFKEGSIVILLGAKFQGKKAVLLKITKNGLFIISGPFSINGISLRRINPRYVAPTEIEVDLFELKLGFLNDNYFNFLKKSYKLYSNYQKQKLISMHRARQLAIDDYLKKEILKNFFLKFYLKSRSKCF